MPVKSEQCVTQHFPLPFSEALVELWSTDQASKHSSAPTFGLFFCAPDALIHAQEILEVVRIFAHVPVMIGCSGAGLIADGHEFENEGGFSISLHYLPDTRAQTIHLPTALFESRDVASSLTKALQPLSAAANGWMLFASSESFQSEVWLGDWDVATGGRPSIGGFACNAQEVGTAFLYADGEIYEEGVVALALTGAVTIELVVSQGCRPVGSPWTVTSAENNIIHQIGNRPILEVLRDTLEGMSQQEQQLARGNIFIGLVQDEYKQSFEMGDFLVRNLAGIDPKTGAVAIATQPRIGQNLQFQIRDGDTASINLEKMLNARILELGGRSVYGACLCDCIGRGTSLFGVPDHDVRVIRDVLPGLNVGGVFCNGEFATVNGRTQLHGYAACLALFVKVEAHP